MYLLNRFSPSLSRVIFGFDLSTDKFLVPRDDSTSSSRPPIYLPTSINQKPVDARPILGRLELLYEPAGKIRQIAIVDPFSQWLLKPLHDWMFNILRKIPQDGTFEQDKPLLKLLSEVKRSKSKFLASLDLSSATDRFSAILQRELLTPFIGQEFAVAWHSFLVDRSYYRGILMKELRYAVGQPMGALSSFSNLAFAHHFL